MALTEEQKRIIKIALAAKNVVGGDADQIIAQIDLDRVVADVADIADTSTATAEDVGNKVNELLAAMRAAGIMA